MNPPLFKRIVFLGVFLAGSGYAAVQVRAQSTTQRVAIGVKAIAVMGLDTGSEVLDRGVDGVRHHRMTYRLTSNVAGLTIRATLDEVPRSVRASLRAQSRLGTTGGFRVMSSETPVNLIRGLDRGVERRGVLDLTLEDMSRDVATFDPVLTLELVGPDGRIHDQIRVSWTEIVGKPVTIAESTR